MVDFNKICDSSRFRCRFLSHLFNLLCSTDWALSCYRQYYLLGGYFPLSHLSAPFLITFSRPLFPFSLPLTRCGPDFDFFSIDCTAVIIKTSMISVKCRNHSGCNTGSNWTWNYYVEKRKRRSHIFFFLDSFLVFIYQLCVKFVCQFSITITIDPAVYSTSGIKKTSTLKR